MRIPAERRTTLAAYMSAYYSTVRRAAVVVCNALATAAPWIGCAAAQALELGGSKKR